MIRTSLLALSALTLAACTTVAPVHSPTPATNAAMDTPDRHTVYVSEDGFALVEARLREAIADRPLTLFTVVDHGEGARNAGMSIGQSKLFLVGNPEIGTPFLQADPQMGLHLPLKILIHDTPDGGTHLAYSHPGMAARTHSVRTQLAPEIERVHSVMSAVLGEAAGDTLRIINKH